MESLRIAWSLIRVPRLFLTFMFFPLLASLAVVYLQLLATGLFARALFASSETLETIGQQQEEHNLVRLVLFGDGHPRPPIRLCRWTQIDGGAEVPPADCQPDRLDVALRVKEPRHYNADEYLKILTGNVERLHLCATCSPDIIIFPEQRPIEAHIHSIWALALISVARVNPDLQRQRLNTMRDFEHIVNTLGRRILHIPGFRTPVSIHALNAVFVLVLNAAMLIIIALWLSLRAHRKVLDYFTRSGALLPLVAACGRGSFYGALWVITLLRVGLFLGATIPIAAIELGKFFSRRELSHFLGSSTSEFALWLLALVASLSLAAVTASLADLRHRHNYLSFAYRYIPVFICFFGALVWIATFLFEGSTAVLLRNITTGLPVLGMTPVLVAPIFKPPYLLLLAHIVLAFGTTWWILKQNARWFAAHLEEL